MKLPSVPWPTEQHPQGSQAGGCWSVSTWTCSHLWTGQLLDYWNTSDGFGELKRVSNVFESGKCQTAAEYFNKEEGGGGRWRSPCHRPTDCLFLILNLIITSVSGSDSKWIYLPSIKSSHLHPDNHPKVKMWSWSEAEKWKHAGAAFPNLFICH